MRESDRISAVPCYPRCLAGIPDTFSIAADPSLYFVTS